MATPGVLINTTSKVCSVCGGTGSVKPALLSCPVIEDALKLFKATPMQKVGDLKAEQTVTAANDMKNLLAITRFRGGAFVIPVAEELFSTTLRICPSEAQGCPKVREGHRHDKTYSTAVSYNGMGF